MADFRPRPFTLPDCSPSLQQSQWIDVAGADLCSLGGACCCALGFNAAEVKIRNDALTWLSDDFCRTTVQYGHVEEGGHAIASGFVYPGKIAPLGGKYIFGDITPGHIWWADFKEMIAVDDGNPKSMAAIHPMGLLWQTVGGKEELYPSLYPITVAAYHTRGGKAEVLPGVAARVAKGRADIRFAVDRSGELFLMTKSDGMIREVIGAVER
jgi:hypothetical protein